MKEDKEDTVQVYWCRGRLVLRAKPSNQPTEAQLLARKAFGEAARQAAGMKMNDSLPPAAVQVAKELTNHSFGKAEKLPKWKLLLSRILSKQGYSQEEAMIILDSLES